MDHLGSLAWLICLRLVSAAVSPKSKGRHRAQTEQLAVEAAERCETPELRRTIPLVTLLLFALAAAGSVFI